MLIWITIGIICLCVCVCLSCIVLPILRYRQRYYSTNGPWKCINTTGNMYVVSRINKGESECMYNNDGIGCYIISPAKNNGTVDEKNLKEQCDNFITNYPNVTSSKGDKLKLDIYTCGENSKNKELWGNTGYDNPNDACAIIKSKNPRTIMEVLFG